MEGKSFQVHSTNMAASRKSSNVNGRSATVFEKHAIDKAALADPAPKSRYIGRDMNLFGKVAVFLVVPTCCGLIALYVAFLETYRKPDRKLSIESDFALPFMLTLFMSIVIWIRTGGFASSDVEPFIKMPKIQKKRKIIHKYIVKGQDPNAVPTQVDEDVVIEGGSEDKKEVNSKKRD